MLPSNQCKDRVCSLNTFFVLDRVQIPALPFPAFMQNEWSHIDQTFMGVMSHLMLDIRANTIISHNVKLFL